MPVRSLAARISEVLSLNARIFPCGLTSAWAAICSLKTSLVRAGRCNDRHFLQFLSWRLEVIFMLPNQ